MEKNIASVAQDVQILVRQLIPSKIPRLDGFSENAIITCFVVNEDEEKTPWGIPGFEGCD